MQHQVAASLRTGQLSSVSLLGPVPVPLCPRNFLPDVFKAWFLGRKCFSVESTPWFGFLGVVLSRAAAGISFLRVGV